MRRPVERLRAGLAKKITIGLGAAALLCAVGSPVVTHISHGEETRAQSDLSGAHHDPQERSVSMAQFRADTASAHDYANLVGPLRDGAEDLGVAFALSAIMTAALATRREHDTPS